MRLIQGDCLNEMKDLSDNSIDLLFCDLPYGQTSCKWDCLIDLNEFWREINRICKDTTPMFFTCTTKFGVSLINSNPKNFRYDLVWVKSASCGFLNAKKMPMKKHEMIYVFYKKLPLYDVSSHIQKKLPERKTIDYKNDSFIYGKIDRPDHMRKNGESSYDPPLPNTVIKILPVPQLVGCEGKVVRKKPENYDPPLPNTILEVKSEKGKHATQKPVELIKWILKYYSKEGDIVLDPTMGSGTTGVACKDMKREFIGIELNNEIFEIARERIETIETI